MSASKLGAMFAALEDTDEYLKFERIESPLHPRADIAAFLLLHNLVPATGDMVASASHDEIWLDTDVAKLGRVATEVDVLTLVRCGVRYDDELESLGMYT